MENIKVIKGNLIDLAKKGKYEAICHGANCFCKMGSGIAVEIKKNFPGAYDADCKTESGDIRKLGDFTYFIQNYDDRVLLVFNLYSQYNYNAKTKPLDYEALTLSLRKMAWELKQWKLTKIGMPLIGAGLGGGDLALIIPIIYKELYDFDVDIVVFDKSPDSEETIKKINYLLKVHEFFNSMKKKEN